MAQGQYLRLVRVGHWEYVERVNASGVVGIIAITNDDKLVFVEQYRPPLGAVVIEMPAGLVGDTAGAPHEPFAQAAARELEEETGFRAGRLVQIADAAVSAGMSDERIATFLADDLTRVGSGGGDAGERIVVHEVAIAEVDQWLRQRVATGAIVDIKVYAGLHFAREHLAGRGR